MAKSAAGKRVKSGKPRNCPRVFDKPSWPKIRENVLTFVSGVYFVEDAIRAAGLSTQWWYKWQAIAEAEIVTAQGLAEVDGSDDYHEHISADLKSAVEFVEAIRQRQSSTIIACASKVRRTNPLEYLARTRHEQWGKRDRMLLGNDPDNPMPSTVHVYLPDNGRGPAKDEAATSEKPKEAKP